MGGGHYDGDAHKALTATRVDLPREQVFRQDKIHPTLNPLGVDMRESRDSENHPNSVAIMMILDETGSMGHIPEDLAKRDLPTFPTTLIEEGTLPDAQVMMGAVGDARNGEQSPLQVGQFESEGTLMDQDLTRIHMEGNGGGNGGESYELPIYFAARHTSMDCWEKRGRKGYLFITGDDKPFSHVSAREVKRYIGDDLERDIPIEEIIAECAKRFHIFFLIPDANRRAACEAAWRKKLGDNVICMESHMDTSLVAASLIGVTEGTYDDLEDLQASLKKRKVDSQQAGRIHRAVAPYAAAIGKGGTRPEPEDAGPPTGQGKSRAKRL